MSLKNKRILITAGPTWVSIDSVRVISNVATGETGILLAKEACKQGASVTLLLGPVSASSLPAGVRLIPFMFFEELKSRAIAELKAKKYDFIIHSAAVSDFKPADKAKGKISSGRRLKLDLIPLPKVIDAIKKSAGTAKIAIFKLEAGVSDSVLIRRAKKALEKHRSDIVVANQLYPYHAFIIDKKGDALRVDNKKELVRGLLKRLDRE